jgi:hypothetical protein
MLNKINLMKQFRCFEKYWSGTVLGPMVDFCEHDKKVSGSMKTENSTINLISDDQGRHSAMELVVFIREKSL